MSGHSHSKTIKHEKDITDQKRGRLFSKLLKAIAIAARTEPNLQFNPRLRTAVEKARTNNVPQENIERAIKHASEEKNLEEIIIGAYGPEGSTLLIRVITDNKNRTIPEIKKILGNHDVKFADTESILWAFEQAQTNADYTQTDADSPRESASSPRESAIMGWQAKFKQQISEENKNKINGLIEALENQDDVQNIYSNI